MKRLYPVVPHLLAWLAFFALTLLTPIYADDFGNLFGYYRQAPLEPGQFPTLRTFVSVPGAAWNLLELIWTHWNHETGRFAAAFLLRLTAGMPHWLFAAFNASVWVALWAAFCRLLAVPRGWRPAVFAAAFAFALTQDACLWLSGACNYLWPMAWMVAAALLFVRPRLGERVFAWRNAWMAALLPLGFVAAGGHELLSVSACLALTVYWLREIAKGRFAVNGRLLLTVGLGLGALAVVFAPGTLTRAGGAAFFAPDAQLLYSIARKGMAYLRCGMANPLLFAVTAGTVVVVVWRRRFSLPERAWWVLLVGWSMVVVTCALSAGGDRTAWPASVCALAMAVVLARHLAPWAWMRWRVPVTLAVSLLAVAVVGVTAANNMAMSRAADAVIRAWRDNPQHVAVSPEVRKVCAASWLDRSWELRTLVGWGMGEPWTNPSVARFYGKPFFILAEPAVWEGLYLRDTLCVPQNRLPCGWYARADADVLALPLPEGSMLRPGTRVSGKPTYADVPPPLSVVARLRKRILREGWASFSLISPEQEMQQGSPLTGYVLPTPHGRYLVLRHNRNIPRESIADIQVSEE